MIEFDTYVYTLPSGAEIEVQNVPEKLSGPRNVAKDIRDSPRLPFETVIAPLGEVCELVFEKLKSSVKAPDTIALEISASLKGQTKLVIVSGEAQGTVKVTLTWKNHS